MTDFGYPVAAGTENTAFSSNIDSFGYSRSNISRLGFDSYRECDEAAQEFDGDGGYDSTTTGMNSSATPNTQASTRTSSTSRSNSESQPVKPQSSHRHSHHHHHTRPSASFSSAATLAELGQNTADLTQSVTRPSSKKPGRKSKSKAAGSEDQKRNKFLERNRLAASKCRQKKKAWVAGLEDQKVGLENQHSHLQTEYHGLVEEISGLKQELMSHASCNDPNINQWLENEARKFVQTTSEKLSGGEHHRSSHGSRRTSTLSTGQSGSSGGSGSREGYVIDPMLGKDGTMEDDMIFSPTSTQDPNFCEASGMYGHG